jgi:hypothetical protein
MALGDMVDKARRLLESEKAQQALKSEKAEGVGDAVLGRAADLADRVSGGKHTESIQKARDAADKRIGDR